ncbi:MULTISPECIES: oxidoreductase [Enterobacter]
MQLGFVGLGAVVETAYLPALRRLYGHAVHCFGFDVLPTRQPEGVTRCASLTELLAVPLDTLFITTASLHHLEVLEQAIASAVPRIVIEKPIVATLPQIEKLNVLLANPDARTLRHPDGVILDIGTHVLAMLRETVRYLGGSDDMTLQVVTAKDRLGRAIAKGDLSTAEGEAHLQGRISGVPVDIWLNKYAGPAGGQKGLRLCLRDGRIISYDRRCAEDVLELIEGKDIERWHIPGTLYEHCLAGHILGTNSLFERDPHEVSRTTRRRIEEVELLLTLQQQLRGPH